MARHGGGIDWRLPLRPTEGHLLAIVLAFLIASPLALPAPAVAQAGPARSSPAVDGNVAAATPSIPQNVVAAPPVGTFASMSA